MGGGLSDVALAVAVTRAGGVGMLGAGGVPVLALESMLDAMSQETDGPFGANFLMPFVDREPVQLAARRCRVCDFHFGDPDATYVDLVHEGGALAGWQVGSPQEAVAAVEAGCDFVIAQGLEAGGHVRGSVPLDELLAQIVGVVEVPIVASGGIGTPERVREVIEDGAAAVRIGTRLLAALESSAHPDYVDALIGAGADETELTETFGADWPNAPHRVLSSSIEAARATTDDVVATMGDGDDAFPVQRFSSLPPTTAVHGNVAAMAMYAGTSVGDVRARQPAAEIVADLTALL